MSSGSSLFLKVNHLGVSPIQRVYYSQHKFYLRNKKIYLIYSPLSKVILSISCADPEGGHGAQTPMKNHKNIGSLSKTDPDPMNNHKAFNVEPSSARQRNAIRMMFCWQADDCLLKVVFGSSPLPSTTSIALILLI